MAASALRDERSRSFAAGAAGAGNVEAPPVEDAQTTEARRIAALLGLPFDRVMAEQGPVLTSFVNSLKTEYPELFKTLCAFKDPEEIQSLPTHQRGCFWEFLLRHKASLKVLLGYVTTGWPLVIQYLYGPYKSVADHGLATIFAISGIFVNAGLSGTVAGPLFADAIISLLEFLKTIVIDRDPGKAWEDFIRYWTPEEWTEKYQAYLGAQAVVAASRDADYIKRQRLFSLTLPVVRVGVTGVASTGSYYLALAFANGVSQLAGELRYPVVLPAALMSATAMWMIAVNAVTYGLDAAQAGLGKVHLGIMPDEIAAQKIDQALRLVQFMNVRSEAPLVKAALAAWLQSGDIQLQAMARVFEVKFIRFLDRLATEESFESDLRVFLEAIVKEGTLTDIEAKKGEVQRLRLPPNVVLEVIRGVLNERGKSALYVTATAVVNSADTQARLRVIAKMWEEEKLRELHQLVSKLPTSVMDTDPLHQRYKGIAQFFATHTSAAFGLALISFIQENANVNLVLAMLAAFIVYYFSDLYFYKGLIQISNSLIRSVRTYHDGGNFKALIAPLVLGLFFAAFSGASAMWQGGGDLPPWILGLALRVLLLDMPSLAAPISGLNGAVVNSYGALQLAIIICSIIGLLGAWLMKSCSSEVQGASPTGVDGGSLITSPLLGGVNSYGAVSTAVSFKGQYGALVVQLLQTLKTKLSAEAVPAAIDPLLAQINSGSFEPNGLTRQLVAILSALPYGTGVKVWFARGLQAIGFSITETPPGNFTVALDADLSARFAHVSCSRDDQDQLRSMQEQLATALGKPVKSTATTFAAAAAALAPIVPMNGNGVHPVSVVTADAAV